MGTTRLFIKCNGVDVSDDCKFEPGQGYEVHRIVHTLRGGMAAEVEVVIGTTKFGHVLITEPGYTHEIVEEP